MASQWYPLQSSSSAVVRNRLKVFSIVLLFAWPVVTSFMSVAAERMMPLRRHASRLAVELPLVVGAGLGMVAHYRAVNTLVVKELGKERFIVELQGDIAFCFMMVNVLMLILAVNLWLLIHGGKKVALHLKMLPLVVLVGPAAHLSLHGILHERRLRELKSNKKE